MQEAAEETTVDCCICLEPLDANVRPVTKLPNCGHAMHTDCALMCAWKGNIACPTCRCLPINVSDADDVEENRDMAIDAHNRAEMQKHFRKGMRMASSKNAPAGLKTAVRNYRKHIDFMKEQAKRERVFRKAQNDAVREARASFENIKKKHRDAIDKIGYDGSQGMRNIRILVEKILHSRSRRSTIPYKEKIARAVGWRRIDNI